MIESSRLSRREALQRLILLPVTAGSTVATNSAVARQPLSNKRVLVAYFSRTGNTQVHSGAGSSGARCRPLPILPAEAYPEDYEATVRQAQRQREAGYEPPLKATLANIASYEVIFLGFPIWGMTAPAVIRSFLLRTRSVGQDPRAVRYTWRLRPRE